MDNAVRRAAARGALAAADRVRALARYAPGQRVGPCTSNHFVASRFRASVYGVAAMRQAFEDVRIYDEDSNEFPGSGIRGVATGAEPHVADADAAHDRPGYPTHAFCIAKGGFSRAKDDWCCVCSTEEMIYNKICVGNPGFSARTEARC